MNNEGPRGKGPIICYYTYGPNGYRGSCFTPQPYGEEADGEQVLWEDGQLGEHFAHPPMKNECDECPPVKPRRPERCCCPPPRPRYCSRCGRRLR